MFSGEPSDLRNAGDFADWPHATEHPAAALKQPAAPGRSPWT